MYLPLHLLVQARARPVCCQTVTAKASVSRVVFVTPLPAGVLAESQVSNATWGRQGRRYLAACSRNRHSARVVLRGSAVIRLGVKVGIRYPNAQGFFLRKSHILEHAQISLGMCDFRAFLGPTRDNIIGTISPLFRRREPHLAFAACHRLVIVVRVGAYTYHVRPPPEHLDVEVEPQPGMGQISSVDVG
jgi:hypothetical protein